MNILVVGSVAFDTIKTPQGSCKEVLGGSATYFSLSAQFFCPVRLVAVVGEDFPDNYIALFKKRNIDLSGLKTEKGRTFRWEGEYAQDLNTAVTLATHLNVFASFDPQLPESYKNSKYVFLANIDPEIQEKVLKQVRAPKIVVCDTMNHWIANKRRSLVKFLKHVDIFLLNEGEARQLSQEHNLVKASRVILKLGAKRVVIKKGEHGAMMFGGNSHFSVPAFLLESVFDPTGAGDTFAGGFMGYLAKCGKITERTLRKAVVYGNIMATFAVEKFSVGRLLEINRTDINKRLKDFKNLTGF
ncbi:MAG: PfkB family carbohydrate kinase [Candidatus Omnitrophica bacterium]|nr:PfkB family carbohydrate kinase [Candidatus Omnitrophota bacterium]